jgi:hypothetical protein
MPIKVFDKEADLYINGEKLNSARVINYEIEEEELSDRYEGLISKAGETITLDLGNLKC